MSSVPRAVPPHGQCPHWPPMWRGPWMTVFLGHREQLRSNHGSRADCSLHWAEMHEPPCLPGPALSQPHCSEYEGPSQLCSADTPLP